MKARVAIGVCVVIVVLAMANLLQSYAQQPAGSSAPPLSNPLKVCGSPVHDASFRRRPSLGYNVERNVA